MQSRSSQVIPASIRLGLRRRVHGGLLALHIPRRLLRKHRELQGFELQLLSAMRIPTGVPIHRLDIPKPPAIR